MIRYDCRQNSEEWDRLRLGIPTSSEFKKIVTPKGKLSAQARPYMHRLLAEWYFGSPLEDPASQYQSQWMERGQALESQAVESYEFETDRTTERVGFITTDDGLAGTSPDRLVGEDGILEIKCPSPAVHMGYMIDRSVDEDYWPQLQGQLLITGRQWVDIESYCPPFPTVIIRVKRDEKYIATLAEALGEFCRVLVEARVKIAQTYGPPLQAREEVVTQ